MLTRRELLALGFGAVTGAVTWPLWPVSRSTPEFRDAPLPLRPVPFADTEKVIDEQVLSAVRTRLRWRPEMAFSDHLHWLRIFGMPWWTSEFQGKQARDTIALLTDTHRIESTYGQRGIIVESPEGIQYLSRVSGRELIPQSRPHHPFQELAVFGELGLAATTAVIAETGTFSLRDALHHCLQNLQIREARRQEPEWVTQVLAHYLVSPSWKNR